MTDTKNKIKIVIVAGPTASGKSDKAVNMAVAMNGEVISADSRQVYNGLDVGTGKIKKDEMKGIRHHCLDIINIGEGFSVSDWLRHATLAIDDIVSRGKAPIICGGTGFYIDALIYGLPDNGIPDLRLRDELQKLSLFDLEQRYKSNLNINNNLNIDFKNKRRLIRAIEINESGRKIIKRNREPLYDIEYVLLNIEKEILINNIKNRCIQRLDIMISETENILKDGKVDDIWLSSIGIEYKQIILYLKGGLNGRQELISSIVTKSWQYAKRQMTWNKKYVNINK